MKLSAYLKETRSEDINTPDAVIKTSSGLKIPVHSSALASASPVLKEMMERRRKRWRLNRAISILGAPSDAVLVFLQLLCSTRSSAIEQPEVMDKYGMHLMVLSHVYQVKWLKELCLVELALRLTVDSVVDMLQLCRQCDVPRLYLQCMRLLKKEFAAVEKTEAWEFLQKNDPWLELEILKFLEEEEMSQKRWKSKMEQQKVYFELSEAMECLQHICSVGCTCVGPHEAQQTPSNKKGISCPNYKVCLVLQNLIRHLAACRTNRAYCPQCRRVSDLLRLHSSICDLDDHCKVPLCKQFKLRNHEGKSNDGRWRLLAKRVASVKTMSFIAKRRVQDLVSNKRC